MRNSCLVFLLLLSVGLTGCTQPTNPMIKPLQEKYLKGISEEPSRIDALAAKESFQDPEHQEKVILVGQIGGSTDCFDQDIAAFLVMDVSEDGHESAPGHDPDACAFCKRRRADAPSALVQFMDDQKKPIPLRADQLFGLKKGQKVVVEGIGRFDKESKTLFVTASKLQP